MRAFVIARGSPPQVYYDALSTIKDSDVIIYVNNVSHFVTDIVLPDYIVSAHKSFDPSHYKDIFDVPILYPMSNDEYRAADGSSSLLAVRIALNRLGCNEVIVVGSPLTEEYKAFRIAWDDAAQYWFRGRVKGTDGYPKELLCESTT